MWGIIGAGEVDISTFYICLILKSLGEGGGIKLVILRRSTVLPYGELLSIISLQLISTN